MADQLISLNRLQIQSMIPGKFYEQISRADAGQSDSLSQTESFRDILENLVEGTGAADGFDICGLLQGSAIQPEFATTRTTSGDSTGVSDQLLDFLAQQEGYSATPYRGVDYQNQTIGYGHVIEPGENYSYLSKSDALQLLREDLSGSVASVKKEFADTNLTQNQFDALVSFAYNLGNNIWSKVPQLTSDIKSGASEQTLEADFARCDHVNGVEVRGLYNRRINEWKMFTQGVYET